MAYLEIGFYLAAFIAIAFPIIILKRRFFEDSILEELYNWWDGREGHYEIVGVFLEVFLLLLAVICTFFILWLAWGGVVPIGLLVIFLNMYRNKRIKMLKKNKNN